jgi:hypothetical protein
MWSLDKELSGSDEDPTEREPAAVKGEDKTRNISERKEDILPCFSDVFDSLKVPDYVSRAEGPLILPVSERSKDKDKDIM